MTYLVVTIDTEEDMPGWQVQPTPRVTNAAALPRLQRVCEKHGLEPTYLVTHPMATLDPARGILKELAAHAEIGAHLHAWTCPPFDGERTDRVNYQKDLSRERQREKLLRLGAAIEQELGVRPTSHRAGRFGLDEVGFEVLEELGYLVDSSVAPLIDLRADGGPDYRAAPLVPYAPRRGAWLRAGAARPLLEVPVGIALTRALPAPLRWAYLHSPRALKLRGLLSKDYLGWIDLFWLYPTQYAVAEMQRAAHALRRAGSAVWTLFLHSSELAPGQSPYTRSAEEVDRLLERIDEFLAWALGAGGAKPARLSALPGLFAAPRSAR
jgi:peptidoglycan/xylan/chitin deacetylase (PgdA/CDA1 family)